MSNRFLLVKVAAGQRQGIDCDDGARSQNYWSTLTQEHFLAQGCTIVGVHPTCLD